MAGARTTEHAASSVAVVAPEPGAVPACDRTLRTGALPGKAGTGAVTVVRTVPSRGRNRSRSGGHRATCLPRRGPVGF
ncbi:hypothetical protein [Streptomyces sp. NPDC008092]|uniref:hypothetical protein n=1 Tax=Streptomyces sp. NPDC008092 TaxID=3364808 RepID=UPI0036E84B84